MDPRLVENPTFLRYYERWQADPKSVVFAAISEIFRGYGMFDEAIRVAEEGLKYHPNFVSGRVALGKAYLAAGDFGKAKEEALRVLNAAPNNHEAAAIIEALKEFEVETKPVVEQVPAIAAIPASMQPQVKQAAATYDDFEEDVTEDMPFALIDSSDDETLADEPQDKETTLDAADVNDDKDNADIEDEATQTKEAEASASKASLNPAWHTITMARILASQGHAGQAKKIYRSILSRDPKNEAARLELSKL